jgi:hypothetical protein
MPCVRGHGQGSESIRVASGRPIQQGAPMIHICPQELLVAGSALAGIPFAWCWLRCRLRRRT